MVVQKEYRVMKNGKFLLEKDYGTFDYVTKEEASVFYSLESVSNYVFSELDLDQNHSLHVTTITTKEEEMCNVGNYYLPKSETETCSHCNTRYPMNELRKGRVDYDSELEFYCEDCCEEVDSKFGFIIPNQEVV